SLLGQKTDLPFEVIVVGMDKFGLVEKYPQVQFIQTPAPVGAAEARNIGIRAARGEWLLFIDSDCIAQAGWIDAFADAFREGWRVVGGGVISPQVPFWLLVYNLSMFHGELASQKRKERRFFPTLNLAVHRQVIEDVGYMDESLPRGQDIEWTARMTQAGHPLLFEPAAAIEHRPERTDLLTLRAYVRKSGYYTIQVRLRHPEVFRTPRLMGSPLFLRLFAPLIAALTTIKIVLQTKEIRQHARVIPYIYLQKISWCQGAAESLSALKRKDSIS
ncbi:MAG: glycosyltransferase, partial [Brevefilum sp.]|nr:glycosyltransferase [Brevefilum sp.]